MDLSVSTLRSHQRKLREAVAGRFAIDHEELVQTLFFRTSSHKISLGRACELPIESMSTQALTGSWCTPKHVMRCLTSTAVHMLRKRAHANVLSLDSRKAELFLGHAPLTMEVSKNNATPGCVILEHGRIVLGIGWLDDQGRIQWQSSDSEALGFREESGHNHSNQFH